MPPLILKYHPFSINTQIVIVFWDYRSKVNDPERMVLEVDFLLPKLQFDGTYKMEGAIGDLVVQGRGVYGANMSKCGSF